ncbi:MAG: hypothetical protein J7L82_05755, partial [Staphylothermus sp.]|nr:hypothetical protein [Staphylothermus sp.]
ISYYLWFAIPLILYIMIIYGALRVLYETSLLPNLAKRIYMHVLRLWERLRGHSMQLTDSSPSSIISIYLVIGLVLSLVISILPYIPTLNPENIPVNTDWVFYYNWLRQMISGDFSVLYARSDRPLYLLFLYSIWFITRIDPKIIAVYHNVITLSLYTFSSYLLALRWADRKTAELTALITPFSPMFLSFIYGGFQANLFAISLVFISIYLIMSSSKRGFFAGLFLFWLVMFIHEWTWTQYIFVLTAYVALRMLRKLISKGGISWRDKALLYFIIFCYAVDLAKQFLFNMFSVAVVARTAIPPARMNFIDSLHWYITIYTGGSLDNPLFYIISLLGLDLLGLSIPGLAVVLSLLPAFLPWKVITYRLLLNTPLVVLAAQGLSRVSWRIRVLLLVSLIGMGLWRLYSIIPGLSLS